MLQKETVYNTGRLKGNEDLFPFPFYEAQSKLVTFLPDDKINETRNM